MKRYIVYIYGTCIIKHVSRAYVLRGAIYKKSAAVLQKRYDVICLQE